MKSYSSRKGKSIAVPGDGSYEPVKRLQQDKLVNDVNPSGEGGSPSPIIKQYFIVVDHITVEEAAYLEKLFGGLCFKYRLGRHRK